MKEQPRDNSRTRSDRLCDLSAPTLTIVLVIDLLGVIAVGASTIGSPAPARGEWALFGGLLAAALLYIRLTRPMEERRRGERLEQGKVEHVDQTSLWFSAAALVLPVTLAVAIVVLVRYRRYQVARKPLGIWISSTSAILLSVVAVGWVRDLIGGSWLTGHISPDSTAGLRCALLLVAASVAYYLAQSIPIGIYRGIRYGGWRLGATLGSREDNRLFACTLLIGMLTALVAATVPYFLAAPLALAVRVTRQAGRLATAEANARRAQLDAERSQRDAQRLQVDVVTDPLTGLLNRRGFDLQAPLVLVTDQSSEQHTSVLMLDVDFFKEWNTRLGHVGADKVLVAVAKILRGEQIDPNTGETIRRDTGVTRRRDDVTGRWGGEEFVKLLPNTDSAGAMQVAEEIRKTVEGLRLSISKPAGGAMITIGTGKVPRCTISIGVATSPQHATGITELQELADHALKHAKERGRNQVVLNTHVRLVPPAEQATAAPKAASVR